MKQILFCIMFLCLANNVYAVDYCADSNLVFGLIQNSDPSPSTTIQDCGTLNHDGTLDSDNNPDYTTDVPSGYGEGSFDFSTDKISMGDHDDFSFTNTSFTYGAWFKVDTARTTLNDRMWIMAKGSSTGNYEYAIYTHGTGSSIRIACVRWATDNSDIRKEVGTTSLSTDTWYHGTCAYNAANDTFAMYLNKVDEGGTQTGPGGSETGNGTSILYIGQRNGTENYYLDGHVYEPFLYNGLLSSTQVGNIYDDGLDGTNGVGSGGGVGGGTSTGRRFLTMPLPQRMDFFGKKELEILYAKIKYSGRFSLSSL